METNDQQQINQEMQAADQIRATQAKEQLAAGNKARNDMQGKVWDGVMSALDDIHRRVIEQGFYGRDVNDVLHHIHNRPDPEKSNAKNIDQDLGSGQKNADKDKDASPDKASEQTAGPEHDYSPDRFYNRDLGR